MKRKATPEQQLVTWARNNIRGLDDAAAFVGIMDDRPMDAGRAEFTLQLGHCLLTDKPIIISVPHGVTVPAKLQRVADRIVRYDPADLKTMHHGMAHALAELGFNKQ